ncbi:MAG: septum formation protein Maf [Elusimicrobia bacterium]|nr:septum formation protein Maf [Elusimicrobiota bacterium]
MIKLILASRSPQRKKILKDAGFKFIVVDPNVKEGIFRGRPSNLVKRLALKKAEAVKGQITNYSPRLLASSSTCRSGSFGEAGKLQITSEWLVVGADTVVVLNGKIIGKPRNIYDAKRILKKLSGSTHYVYTGIAILKNEDKKLVDYEKTKIIFRKLSSNDIRNVYKKYLDKAGAYAIQEQGDLFVKNIDGDYTNVVGFPLNKFKRMLDKLGFY